MLFQIEKFQRAARALCFIKVQRSTGREILTAKSRVAEKHSFGFTCFCPKSKSDRVDTAELICKSQINGHV